MLSLKLSGLAVRVTLRKERERERGVGTDLLVYHGLGDKVLLVLRADDVEEDLDVDGAVVLRRVRRVGGCRPASNAMGAFVQLHVRVVEVWARRGGAASSLGNLWLGGDGDGQE